LIINSYLSGWHLFKTNDKIIGNVGLGNIIYFDADMPDRFGQVIIKNITGQR